MVGVEKETTQTLSSVPTHVPSPAQALAIKGAATEERRTRVLYKMGGVAPPQEFFAPVEKEIIARRISGVSKVDPKDIKVAPAKGFAPLTVSQKQAFALGLGPLSKEYAERRMAFERKKRIATLKKTIPSARGFISTAGTTALRQPALIPQAPIGPLPTATVTRAEPRTGFQMFETKLQAEAVGPDLTKRFAAVGILVPFQFARGFKETTFDFLKGVVTQPITTAKGVVATFLSPIASLTEFARPITTEPFGLARVAGRLTGLKILGKTTGRVIRDAKPSPTFIETGLARGRIERTTFGDIAISKTEAGLLFKVEEPRLLRKPKKTRFVVKIKGREIIEKVTEEEAIGIGELKFDIFKVSKEGKILAKFPSEATTATRIKFGEPSATGITKFGVVTKLPKEKLLVSKGETAFVSKRIVQDNLDVIADVGLTRVSRPKKVKVSEFERGKVTVGKLEPAGVSVSVSKEMIRIQKGEVTAQTFAFRGKQAFGKEVLTAFEKIKPEVKPSAFVGRISAEGETILKLGQPPSIKTAQAIAKTTVTRLVKETAVKPITISKTIGVLKPAPLISALRTGQVTRGITRTRVSTKQAIESTTKSKLLTELITKTKQISILKPVTSVEPIVRLKPPIQLLQPITGVKTIQALEPITKTKTISQLRGITPTPPMSIIPVTPPPRVPVVPPVSLFRPTPTKKKKREKPIPSAFAPAYTPTVEAILLGIKGVKPPKALVRTGLGLRPMLK